MGHNGKFLWPILDLLDHNRRGIANVNRTFVILHQDEYPMVVKDWPIFLHQCIDTVLKSLVEVRQVKVLAKIVAVKGLVIPKQNGRIDKVERRRRMFELSEERSTINVVKENIKLVRLVREAPVINESVLNLSMTLVLFGCADRRARQFLCDVGWRRDWASQVGQCLEAWLPICKGAKRQQRKVNENCKEIMDPKDYAVRLDHI